MAKETAKTEPAAEIKTSRDRSPSYPFVPLQTAIERLEAFETYFKRHPGPIDKAGLAWDMKPSSSQSYSTLAALKSFGLIDYQGAGESRVAVISEDGRTYLRAQQQSTKQEVLKRAALRPKNIAKFWSAWGADRPPNPVCLDDLILKNGFSDSGAEAFLKVYDATIAYAGLSETDKEEPIEEQATDSDGKRETPAPSDGKTPPLPTPRNSGVKIMDGERELVTGPLSGDARFRLIVSGHVGSKEIGRLIRKLEMEKEIVEEAEEAAAKDEFLGEDA